MLPLTTLTSLTARGRPLVPVLLLLLMLLPGLLAEDVCFNISDGNISMTSTHVSVTEGRLYGFDCFLNDKTCYMQCWTDKDKNWFNGSSHCFNAELTIRPALHMYNITEGARCAAYFCNDMGILELMSYMDTKDAMEIELIILHTIKGKCEDLFSDDLDVKRAFVKLEEKMIHNIMRRTELDDGGSKTCGMKEFVMNVINITDFNLTGAHMRIQVEAPQPLPWNGSFVHEVPEIWLPVDALQRIPQESRVVGLVSYVASAQFEFNQENIVSMVVRIELLEEHRLHDLETSIKMIFRDVEVENIDTDSYLACHFFDVTDARWKPDGCRTNNETSDNGTAIVCSCDHTTPFAVLLIREPISEIHWQILSYISYIGCGLSAFFTALSLIVYVFGRSNKTDHSISIHVSLSGALFLLNTSFLLTEWGATLEPVWVCVFVAAVMHYSLLSCFSWMAIEALHLYLLLIKVFNTHYKHYMLKLSLAGWGVPALIVGVSLGVKDVKQFYGLTHLTMSDTNQTNSICWITDDSFFYSVNLVYFSLIFVFNSGILVSVASSICRMKQVVRSRPQPIAEGEEGKTWRDPRKMSETCRSGLTVLGLTCLMGTTWGLAFMGSGYVNYPILYLFCILNSTQGFFIFLWICLSTKKQRKREMEERLSSTPVKHTTLKSD